MPRRAAERMLWQAAGCERLGSPLYAGLLRNAAADLLAGGPVAAVLRGHLSDPGRSALSLRMLGGVHALVLAGRAAELAAFYPSVGGYADAAGAWPAFRRVLAEHGDEVSAWLDHPPQTNEIGRGAALAGALCHLLDEADLPVRLVEVGASAGLNLRADRFFLTGAGASFGDPSSPVRIPGAWQGALLPVRPVPVVLRTGGDLAPVDPTTAEGRLRLTAYVWPDQADRLDRLRGACELAERVPADLRAESASSTIGRVSLEPGTWTVVWHSVFRQYLDPGESAALDAGIGSLAAAAGDSARLAHVTLEPVSLTQDFPVEVTTWPGGARRVLGSAPPHGVPVTWVR